MKENVREAPARCYHQQCTRSVGFNPHCWWQRALTFQFTFVWPGRVSPFNILFLWGRPGQYKVNKGKWDRKYLPSPTAQARSMRKVLPPKSFSGWQCLSLDHKVNTGQRTTSWAPSAKRSQCNCDWRSGFFSFSFSLFPVTHILINIINNPGIRDKGREKGKAYAYNFINWTS